MDANITFCAYKQCHNSGCLRHYSNVPTNELSVSWFSVRPKENGICEYHLENKNVEDL